MPPFAEGEAERVAAVNGAIELGAITENPRVVHRYFVPLLGRVPSSTHRADLLHDTTILLQAPEAGDTGFRFRV
jgi:hypothetical protein